MKIEINNLTALIQGRDLNLYQRSLAVEEWNKLLNHVEEMGQALNIADVSNIFPPLNTVKQEINKYKETSQQGNKGHFQNGINWAFNYVAKKVSE